MKCNKCKKTIVGRMAYYNTNKVCSRCFFTLQWKERTKRALEYRSRGKRYRGQIKLINNNEENAKG
tara:strand:+ start:349 stop:546 length:198 start_codon:yes stop_codon:yes gene_type:complete